MMLPLKKISVEVNRMDYRSHDRLAKKISRACAALCLAVKKFSRIDGSQWAGAFAYNAFFSLFPLMILLVMLVSSFVDRSRAGKEVIAYVESYVPISGEMQRHIFETIAGVIKVQGQAGAVAFLILVWVTMQCFTTLISATARAWGDEDCDWWRLPVKSLALLGITAGAVFLGIAAQVLAKMAQKWFPPAHALSSVAFALGSFYIPLATVFLGLSLFYRLAPRRPTRFSEVWVSVLCATLLLQTAESLFVIYLRDFATLNVFYGAFGSIMALLLWIYLSGCIFIFGACLCAAQSELHASPAEIIRVH